MKVIAINDAPIPSSDPYLTSSGIYLDRAYYKGDIFECIDDDEVSTNHILIYHNIIGCKMEVTKSNFMSLDNWRESKINEILK